MGVVRVPHPLIDDLLKLDLPHITAQLLHTPEETLPRHGLRRFHSVKLHRDVDPAPMPLRNRPHLLLVVKEQDVDDLDARFLHMPAPLPLTLLPLRRQNTLVQLEIFTVVLLLLVGKDEL